MAVVRAAVSLRPCELDDSPRSLRRFNVPESLGLFRPNKFAVVRERDAAVVMAKLQRRVGSVLEMRQVIGREAVPQRVVRPFGDASGETCVLE